MSIWYDNKIINLKNECLLKSVTFKVMFSVSKPTRNTNILKKTSSIQFCLTAGDRSKAPNCKHTPIFNRIQVDLQNN